MLRKNTCRLVTMFILTILFITSLPMPAFGETQEIPYLKWVRDTLRQHSGSLVTFTRLRHDELPTVDDAGNAYITPEDGYLYSLNPEGIMRWKVNLNQSGHSSNTGSRRPIIDGEGNLYIGSGDGNLYAINPQGEVLWTFAMEGSVSAGTSPAFSPDGKTIYVVTGNRYLHAVDLEGNQQWNHRLSGSSVANTPTVASDGIIYVGTSRVLKAVKPNGETKWQVSLDYNIHIGAGLGSRGDYRMAVGENGTLYLMAGRREGGINAQRNALLALDPADGSIKWSRYINANASSPVIDGDTIYYKTSSNFLHALDKYTGEEKWNFRAEDEYYGREDYYVNEPRLEPDGTLLVPFGNGLYALEDVGTEGRLKWKTEDLGFGIVSVSRYGPGGELYCIGRKGHSYILLKLMDPGYAPEPQALEFAEGKFAMVQDSSHLLQPRIEDAYGRIVKQAAIQWESSNPAVVSVDQDGMVSALKEGRAEITVKGIEDPTIAASVEVTVLKEKAGLRMEISPSEAQLEVGNVLPLIGAIYTSDELKVLGLQLEWTLSSQVTASITPEGAVTGLQPGHLQVRGRVKDAPDITASMVLTVEVPEVGKVRPEEIEAAMERTINYYKRQSGRLTDWPVFALNAAGENVNEAPYVKDGKTYLENLEEKIQTSGVGNLMTDYARTIVAVVSAGGDPHFVGGVNLIEGLVKWPDLSQGINAPIWGLIALDAANASVPEDAVHTRESLIKHIIDNTSGGGWDFGGASADADMTGMALYALAPYRDRADVRAAGERAIEALSQQQQEDGRFGSWGSQNSQSIAQVIMGITAWEVDPQGPLFTKKYGNAATALLGYQMNDGLFRHTTVGDPGMATEQGLQGLAALNEFYKEGVSTIFNRIEFAGNIDPTGITALLVYPNGLMLEPGKTITLRPQSQRGAFIPTEMVNWQLSHEDRAELIFEEDSVKIKAIAPGQVYIDVHLKDNPTVVGQGSLVVVDERVTASKIPQESSKEGKELQVQVTNTGEEGRTAIVIIQVLHKDSGELVYQSFVSKELTAGESSRVTGFHPLSEIDGDQYEIRAMLWDGWNRPRPMTNTIGQ